MGGGALGARPVGAVAVGRDIDEIGVDGREIVVADAKLLGDAHAVVVNPDVGLGGQFLGDFLPLGALEIEGDALLAGVALGGAEAVEHGAERIARERLDLDDAGAEIGQAPMRPRGAAMMVALSTTVTPARGLAGETTSPAVAGCWRTRLDGVESDFRRGAADLAGALGEVGKRAQLRHAVAFHHMAVRHAVFVRQGVLRRLVRVRDHAAIAHEAVRPVRQRAALHVFEQAVAERLAHFGRPAHGVAFVLRVLEHFLEPGGAEEIVEEMRQQVAELQPLAIGGAHGVVVEGGHGLGAVPRRLGAFELARILQLHHRHDAHLVGHHAAQHGGVERQCRAGEFAPDQGGEHGCGGALRGGVGAHLQGGVVGAVAVGDAGEVEHAPGLGRHHRLVTGIGGVGAVLAEAGDDADDEVVSAEGFRGESDSLSCFGLQRRQHGVGGVGDQAPQLGDIFRRAKVCADDALAPRPQPVGGHIGEGVAARRHDLDHVGAEVGEDGGGDAGCRADADLNDAEAGKRIHACSDG